MNDRVLLPIASSAATWRAVGSMLRGDRALAVGAVAWVAGGSGGKDEPKTKPAASAPKNAARVSFAYSPEKEKLLLQLIEGFNRSQRKVFVEGLNTASGDAESRIAKGTFKPVAWSPASSP